MATVFSNSFHCHQMFLKHADKPVSDSDLFWNFYIAAYKMLIHIMCLICA